MQSNYCRMTATTTRTLATCSAHYIILHDENVSVMNTQSPTEYVDSYRVSRTECVDTIFITNIVIIEVSKNTREALTENLQSENTNKLESGRAVEACSPSLAQPLRWHSTLNEMGYHTYRDIRLKHSHLHNTLASEYTYIFKFSHLHI